MYQFKASLYSSHALVLSSLPAAGEGRRVLDVGCGDGYLSALLAARGYAVTGIERCGGFSSRFPASVRLIEADLEAGLPALDQRFDYILCADILEHLRRPEDLLAQLRGLLSPEGRLIASLPNSGNIYFRLNVLAGRFPQDDKGLFDRTHLRFYMWAGWQKLLRGAGFRLIANVPSALPVSLIVPARFEDAFIVRLAEGVCFGLARLWMTMFAYQFVVSAVPDDGSARK